MDLARVSLMFIYRVRDYVSAATRIGQDRHPETMGRFYIINAPFGFSTVWGIIKPWLDPVTGAKIDIIVSGSVKQQLLAQVLAENSPKEYGGEYSGGCTCYGKGGCPVSNAGAWSNMPALVKTLASEAGGVVEEGKPAAAQKEQ